jgi:hypothetical protein
MNRFLGLVLLLVGTSWAVADVESGPKAGEKASEFKVFAVTGEVENKEVNFIKDRKDEPTIYYFVQKEHWSRPMAKYLRTMDTKASELSDKVQGVAVWLGGDVKENKEYLPKAQQSLKLTKTALTVFEGEKTGPNNWGINSDAHLTTVIVNKGKVVKSFPYDSVNDSDVRAVLMQLKQSLGK